MKVHQRTVAGKIVISGIHAKIGVSNGGARHIYAVNDFLEEGRRMVVGLNVVNGEGLDGGRKSETPCIFNQKESKNHMTNNYIT